jgi:hypothetical protein
MAGDNHNTDPAELIYLPEPSWAPLMLAAGLAAVLASFFTWWPYGVAGAIVALFAIRAWIADSRQDYGRLPRHQRVTSAVLPAIPYKKPDRA